MENPIELFEDLSVTVSDEISINKYRFYLGSIGFYSNPKRVYCYEIKTNEAGLKPPAHSSDLIYNISKCLIAQNQFDCMLDTLKLSRYKNEFLLHFGDLMEFYLNTKLFLEQQEKNLISEVELERLIREEDYDEDVALTEFAEEIRMNELYTQRDVYVLNEDFKNLKSGSFTLYKTEDMLLDSVSHRIKKENKSIYKNITNMYGLNVHQIIDIYNNIKNAIIADLDLLYKI